MSTLVKSKSDFTLNNLLLLENQKRRKRPVLRQTKEQFLQSNNAAASVVVPGARRSEAHTDAHPCDVFCVTCSEIAVWENMNNPDKWYWTSNKTVSATPTGTARREHRGIVSRKFIMTVASQEGKVGTAKMESKGERQRTPARTAINAAYSQTRIPLHRVNDGGRGGHGGDGYSDSSDA